jgi:hypothetical protein
MKFLGFGIVAFSALSPALALANPSGLGDLEKMTFSCPEAGLNAAAREAAKVPTAGAYQFGYFKLINDSSNSTYEVGFKSNVSGEPDVNYTVTVYCQVGIPPHPEVTRR